MFSTYAGVGQVSLPALSFVLANAPRLLDWPKSVSVLANAPRLCVRLQGPIWYVLTNAPRLLDWPKSVSCALQCTTSVCPSIGSNLICAHQCTASIWRGGAQICFLCSLMHHVFVSAWRVPPCFVLSNAPCLLDWPESVYVLSNAPRLCVCL